MTQEREAGGWRRWAGGWVRFEVGGGYLEGGEDFRWPVALVWPHKDGWKCWLSQPGDDVAFHGSLEEARAGIDCMLKEAGWKLFRKKAQTPAAWRVRLLRVFALAGVRVLEDFVTMFEPEVLQLHGVGPVALRTIRSVLLAAGGALGRRET